MTEQVKRVSLFSGHYGSGKTNVAVNYSRYLKSTVEKGAKVSVYDLDIVNPYFRALDAEGILRDNGISLISSPFSNSNVDLPAMTAEAYKMTQPENGYAVVDIGGDDRGALALGRFADKIKAENDYAMYLVINRYRPETRTVEGAVRIKEEIERVSGIRFTAIVNNSNLGAETRAETVENSAGYALGVSAACGLPLAFTAARADLCAGLGGKIQNLLPVEPVRYGKWREI